jgi:hypothetical protein
MTRLILFENNERSRHIRTKTTYLLAFGHGDGVVGQIRIRPYFLWAGFEKSGIPKTIWREVHVFCISPIQAKHIIF